MKTLAQYKILEFRDQSNLVNRSLEFERIPAWMEKIINTNKKQSSPLYFNVFSDGYNASLALPGLIEKTLKVKVKNNVLIISGKNKINELNSFVLKYIIPSKFKLENTVTYYKNGVIQFKFNNFNEVDDQKEHLQKAN